MGVKWRVLVLPKCEADSGSVLSRMKIHFGRSFGGNTLYLARNGTQFYGVWRLS